MASRPRGGGWRAGWRSGFLCSLCPWARACKLVYASLESNLGEGASANTVSVEMTRGEYMQFRSYMDKKAEEPKKTMGFARVLNSEETDNKDEEMA